MPVARVYSCALLRWSSPLNNVERLKLRNIIHSVRRKHRLFNRFIMSSNSWKLFCEFWVMLVLIDFYQSFNWCFSVDWVIVLVVSLCIKSPESTSPMWPAVLMKDCVQKCQTQWQMVTKTTSRSLLQICDSCMLLCVLFGVWQVCRKLLSNRVLCWGEWQSSICYHFTPSLNVVLWIISMSMCSSMEKG